MLHNVQMWVTANGDAGGPVTGRFALYASVPNPIERKGSFAYQLPSAAAVSIEVTDVSGRAVRHLAHDEKRPQA